jgi:SAM-dependent methyltransferase
MNSISEALGEAIKQFNALKKVQEKGLFEYPHPLLLAETKAVVDKLPPGGTLIDIGTAAGILPHAIHLLGYKVITIDQSIKGKPTWGMKRANALGIGTVKTTVGKEPLNLPNKTADVVFAGDVVEHLPDSPQPFMKEIVRILKPEGWCILTTPNAVRLPVRIKMMLGYSNWMPLKEYFYEEKNLGHHKEYVVNELVDLLTWSYFKNIEYSYIEDTLRRVGIANSFSDIQTKNRHIGKESYREHFDAFNYMEYARVVAVGITAIFPSLRSSIICQSQCSKS